MHCRFCEKDPSVIVPLPYKPGEDPGQSPYACVPCATEHGYYCPIHSRTHTSSSCGHPFCIECIETEVRLNKGRAEALYAQVKEALNSDDLSELEEAASDAAELTKGTEAEAVVRFIVTLAHRKRISLDEAITLATSENAIAELLPIVIG